MTCSDILFPWTTPPRDPAAILKPKHSEFLGLYFLADVGRSWCWDLCDLFSTSKCSDSCHKKLRPFYAASNRPWRSHFFSADATVASLFSSLHIPSTLFNKKKLKASVYSFSLAKLQFEKAADKRSSVDLSLFSSLTSKIRSAQSLRITHVRLR